MSLQIAFSIKQVMDMKRNRKNAGFSMGELLVVVAILVILMGLGFVALIQYQRTLKQLELDGIAKEIFVAAQNHLTMADSQGLLEGKTDGTADAEKDVYYFVGGQDGTSPDDGSKALSLMLPFASVDETVRAGGSYVIRYQKNGARVLDVFYAQPDNSRFGHTFTDGEYTTLLGLRGDTNKAARRSCGDDKHVIGWYNGDGLTEGKKFAKPMIQIINAERLLVKITNPNTGAEYSGTQLKLIVEGASSGAKKDFTLFGAGALPGYQDAAGDNSKFTVVLDDITTAGKHFADQFAGFYPGENLIIYAEASSTVELVAPVRSAAKQTNSLFASMEEKKDSVTKTLSERTAYISNLRHLENLGTNVSGYIGKFASDDVAQVKASALQTSDLSLPDFLQKTANQKNVTQDGIQITGTSKAGLYLPANPNYPLDYDGQGYRISDIAVEYNGEAGIFGALTNSNIKRVLVCNDNTNDNTKDDSALEITGTGSTGALVGVMNGGSITNCAAAVYVKSTAGDAGGLVGKAENVEISNSYSGGHTQNGMYLDSTEAVRGHYNVQGTTAGGLIGTASAETAVTYSYSTCSAKGDASGGLIGSASGGSVVGCYATGLVSGSKNKTGAFIGTGTPGTLKDNAYYSIINGELSPVGGSAVTVTALDQDLATYNEYVTITNHAQPYDQVLKDYYGGQYALKTISQLAAAGIDAPAWVSAHYGDWPAPETLVVNVK